MGVGDDNMLFHGIRIPDTQKIAVCKIPSDIIKKFDIKTNEDKDKLLSLSNAPNILSNLAIEFINSAFHFESEQDLEPNQVAIAIVDLGSSNTMGTLMFQGALTDKTMYVMNYGNFKNTKEYLFIQDYINHPRLHCLGRYDDDNVDMYTIEKYIKENISDELDYYDFSACAITGIRTQLKDLIRIQGNYYVDRNIWESFTLGGKEYFNSIQASMIEDLGMRDDHNNAVDLSNHIYISKIALKRTSQSVAPSKTPRDYRTDKYQPKNIFQHQSQSRFTNDGVLRIKATDDNPLLYHNYIPKEYKINELVKKKDVNRKTYTLGIELEVEAISTNSHTRNGIVNAVNLLNKNNLENKDRYFVVHDGSLENGLEIVTHPFEIGIDGVPLIIKDMQELLHFLKFNTKTSSRCGLHIHIGRKPFKDDLSQKLNYLFELWNDDIMKVSRRGRENRYCKMPHLFRTNKKLMKLWNAKQSKLYDVSYTEDKYVAINTNHSKTIEIRLWGGTQDPELISMYLELTLLLCVVADKKTYGELKEMQLKDLIPLSNNKAFKKHMCELLGVDIKELTNKKKCDRMNKKYDSNTVCC
jgi:hypothetical protein